MRKYFKQALQAPRYGPRAPRPQLLNRVCSQKRLHSALDYLSPMNFGVRYARLTDRGLNLMSSFSNRWESTPA